MDFIYIFLTLENIYTADYSAASFISADQQAFLSSESTQMYSPEELWYMVWSAPLPRLIQA